MDNQLLEQQIQFHVLHSQHKLMQSNVTNLGNQNNVYSSLGYVFLISLFGVLSQYIVKWLTSPRLFHGNYRITQLLRTYCGCMNENKITLQAKEIKHRNSNQASWAFSDLTKAVLWHCNINIEKMHIQMISESTDDIIEDRWYYIDEEQDAKHNMKTYKRPTFRVDQRTRFLLADDVFIQFCFSREEDDTMSNGKRESISYKVCQIEITSVRRSLSYIQKMLETIHKDYLHEINTNTLKSQYIFIHKGEQKFDQVPFHTNKTWNSFFLENKNKLRQNIQQMKNFEDPNHINKHAGLPDHLVIMADGPPGTGKNSLFKVLMKEEFKDRQLVIIPPSSVKDAQEIVDIMQSEYLNSIYCPWNKCVYQFDEIDKSFPALCSVQPDLIQEKAETTYKALKGPKPTSFGDYMATMIKEEEQKRNLERQVWLNLLDGAHEKQGMVIFMTLNDYDVLDPIFKRPGRIHIRVRMTNASKEMAIDIIAHIFSYDFQDTKINARLEQLQDYQYSQSKIIQACCNAILDFTNIMNNLDYIDCALNTLGY